MKYLPIPIALLQIGQPLPVTVWSTSGQLLLKKGNPILSEQHRSRLAEHKLQDVRAKLADMYTEIEAMKTLVWRTLAEVNDLEIGGERLAAGTYLHIGIGAANRDPAQYADPEVLNLRRQGNKHLAFGFGPHQCAGLSLARLEGRIAIGRFLQRFPDYRLTADPVRGGRARFRGFLTAPFVPG